MYSIYSTDALVVGVKIPYFTAMTLVHESAELHYSADQILTS